MFLKVSLLGTGVEMNGKSFKSIENGQLILQRFKEDWASAQRVVSEARTGTETSMPKRVLERLTVSRSTNTFFLAKSAFSYFCFFLRFLLVNGLENSLSGISLFLISFTFFYWGEKRKKGKKEKS